MEQRIPPQNVEAEQAVLGAMMLEHNAVVAAMEKLRPGDFYREVHRTIFEAMEHLHHDNKEVDVITLPEELRRMKKLDDVGGLEKSSTTSAAWSTSSACRTWSRRPLISNITLI